MSRDWCDRDLVERISLFLRTNQNHLGRPILIFCCGGDPKKYPARSELKRYIDVSKLQGLSNVFCFHAETVAEESVFGDLDLLTQEAIIADASDSLILFAESVGSFCELGAFAALPHIRAILTIGVDKKHGASKSFLNDGPVKMVAEEGLPLNKVFPLDLSCPMKSEEFTAFVNRIRETVAAGQNYKLTKGRKSFNKKEDEVWVGPLVHELLDLVYIFGPVSTKELVRLYCRLKGFSQKRVKILSPTIERDVKRDKATVLTFEQVISFMSAMGIVRSVEFDGVRLYHTELEIEHLFMFKESARNAIDAIIAKNALSKRARREEGSINVYRRYDDKRPPS